MNVNVHREFVLITVWILVSAEVIRIQYAFFFTRRSAASRTYKFFISEKDCVNKVSVGDFEKEKQK